MKKIYLLILLCTCFSLSLFANGIEIDGIYYLLNNTDYTASVTYTDSLYHKNNSYTGKVVIPSSVGYNDHEYVVTSIEGQAFYACSGLTSITISSSITSIGIRAFDGCSSLTSVTIPNSVTSIGVGAFSDCSGLVLIEVEEENTIYDSRNHCNAIIETVTNTLIAGCKNTIIPSSVTEIGSCAFEDCEGLISIDIPDGITNIGNEAFYSCNNLTSVTAPNSVTSIGDYAFSLCSNLKSFIIPNSVTTIGKSTFNMCRRLTSVIIPNSVTSIGDGAFYHCESLTSVTIPNSVTDIKVQAFDGCSGLNTVYCMAETPPTLGVCVFRDIKNTAILYVTYESIDAYKAISEYVNYFAEIKGIYSHVEDITSSTATLKWIPDSTVFQYDINVYTGDTHFAHYLVDGDGQIISSQQFAPAIHKLKMDTTVSSTEYFVISLNGLSAGTDYNYTIDGTNSESAPIYHEEGSFTTMSENEEGFFDVISDDPRKQTQKFIRDGMLFIERNGEFYNPQGIKIQTQNQ